MKDNTRRALVVELLPGSLEEVARVVGRDVCEVATVAADLLLCSCDPSAFDIVLLEMDAPPDRGLRLLKALKQDPVWGWVPLGVVYSREPCDEHLFAVWANGPDLEVRDTPEQSRVEFLLHTLPKLLPWLPPRSCRHTGMDYVDSSRP